MSNRQTWSLEDFGGGIDLRDGLFSSNQTRFRQRRNVWTTKGRKIRLRPPLLRTDGNLDALSQGVVSIDGRFYTFAPKGAAVAHTGAAAGLVETLFFDVPDLCSAGWQLLSHGVYNGHAAAWILHDFPSAAYPKLAFLHVWDGLVFAPTFVQDAYLPGSFSPSIADLAEQTYDATFRPVFGIGASKLWTSTLRGNAQCSRTADARVWNQRTKDGMLEDGEHWCFVVPEGDAALREFTVPRNAAWMGADGRWAYYVLEYSDGDAWTPMTEVAGVPASSWEWSWTAVASRFAGGWDEVRLRVRWGRPQAGLLRLRLVAGSTAVEALTPPTVETTAGTGGLWRLKVGAARYQYRGGDAADAASYVTGDLPEGKTYLLAVSADPVAFPTLWDMAAGFPDGWQREHRRFIKRVVTSAAATGTTELDTTWVPNAYARFTAGKTEMRIDAALAAQVIVGSTLRVTSTSYLVSAIAGQIVTVTNLAGADGDYTANLNALKTVYKTNDPVITPYQYAYESDAESDWYTDLVVEYIDLAGAEDALSLATAAIDNTGGRITAIASVRQRMLIAYAGSMQLWAIDQDTNRTTFLDSQSFGTGAQPTPPAVPWYGAITLPVETGIRAMNVVGANTDNLQDSNIGEPIADGVDLGEIEAAVFWPLRGQLMLACRRADHLAFLCLDYSRESKITAWSEWASEAWTTAGLLGIDPGSLIPAGTDLWFRSGSGLFRFDAAATLYQDWCEAEPFAFSVLFHYNDMGKPGSSKRFLFFDIVQEGTCEIGFRIPPHGSYGEDEGPNLAGPVVLGTTYGRARMPLAMTGPALAPELFGRSADGWELQRLAIDFLTLRR